MSLLPTPDADTLRRLAEERRARKRPCKAPEPATPPPLPRADTGRKTAKRGRAGRQRERVPTEHEEQARFFALVDAHTPRYPDLACVYAVPNFSGRLGRATIRHSVALNAEGRRKGYPDINCDVPRPPAVMRPAYAGLRIEMKRQNATPSAVAPEQREWHARLRAQGYRVEVCKGADAAWRVLCDYLGIEEADRAAA